MAAAFAGTASYAESGNGTSLPVSAYSSFEAPKNVLCDNATLINVGPGHACDTGTNGSNPPLPPFNVSFPTTG